MQTATHKIRDSQPASIIHSVCVCEMNVTSELALPLSYIIAWLDQHRASRCDQGLCWGQGLIGVICGQERYLLWSHIVCDMIDV